MVSLSDEFLQRVAPVRKPAVAGAFYPGRRRVLEDTVRALLGDTVSPPLSVPGCLVPHAGYQYSGAVAASVYREIRVPDRCLLLGPNHTGQGPLVSVSDASSWETPCGKVPVDTDFVERVMRRCETAVREHRAHAAEHALEVQLPFLQALNPHVRIVPVTLFPLRMDAYQAVADALCDAIEKSDDDTLCLVSSDFTHYEPQAVAETQDARVLDALCALDVEGLQKRVHGEGVSMCGVAPATLLLMMAKRLGWTSGTVRRYATSGDVTGDLASVVGYAGMTFA